MTITFIEPTSGDPFGLGFNVNVTSSFVGALPSDAFWTITLTAPANENIVGQRIIRVPSHGIEAAFLNLDGSIFSQGPMHQWSVGGQSAQLEVELASGAGTIDSGTVPVVINNVDGLQAFIVSALGLVAQPGGGATLTPEEHDAVLQTNVGVIAMAGINPLELVGDLVQAIATHNPLGYGSLSVIYTLTGDGELPNEDPVAPKWGVYWVAVTIPAGLGHFHGQSEEYNPRLIQWRTVHEVGGTEMVTSFIDSQTHGELWKFPVQTPRRLEYSILPGVVIQAQWWQFP